MPIPNLTSQYISYKNYVSLELIYSNFIFSRYQNWKLLGTQYFDETPSDFELFDLDADPSETTNLGQQHPEMLAFMEQKFEVRFFLETKLHWPSKSCFGA